jgi:hypothetical protein
MNVVLSLLAIVAELWLGLALTLARGVVAVVGWFHLIRRSSFGFGFYFKPYD